VTAQSSGRQGIRRRFLALWFPFLAADRLAREGAPDTPYVFVERQGSAIWVVAVSRAAHELGIEAGGAWADARARVPDLTAIAADHAADDALLERIAEGCDRYTRLVAVDGVDGLTLDVTGCLHTVETEDDLAADVEQRLAAYGVQVRHALAGTPEAAQALARFQTMPAPDEMAAVRRLGVVALRLDLDTELALRHAGLKTIGDLASRPTAPFAAHFGEAVVAALAGLTGTSGSRIIPRRTAPALTVERRLAEPVTQTEAVLDILESLAGEAAETMTERHQGGRSFAARLFRSDGVAIDLSVETSLEICDSEDVIRLFRKRINGLANPIDPGPGFDMIRLSVPTLGPLAPTQLQLEGGTVAEAEMAALLDRLRTRRGHGRSRRLRARAVDLPEQAVLGLPAVKTAVTT
jgi:protein ImuB